jgi:hypothetical protein
MLRVLAVVTSHTSVLALLPVMLLLLLLLLLLLARRLMQISSLLLLAVSSAVDTIAAASQIVPDPVVGSTAVRDLGLYCCLATKKITARHLSSTISGCVNCIRVAHVDRTNAAL